MIGAEAPALSLADRARAVSQVAAAAAEAVDRAARFPAEAFDEARQGRLLSALIPSGLGGEGASFADVADSVRIIAHGCASSGLIYAMHQIQVACLVRHGDNDVLRDALRRVCDEQLLLASATSEVNVGGDVRTSVCAVEPAETGFTLQKAAPVISYGEQADAVLATARRTPDSPPSDQVLVYLPAGPDLTLERSGEWDTLGFRGTCSLGFRLQGRGQPDQILTSAYGDISAQTMLPVSHILWASVWLGLAESAAAKAHTYLRAAARKSPDRPLAAARRTAELSASLQELRGLIRAAVALFTAHEHDGDALGSVSFAISMNSLKVSASTLVVDIVAAAMGICGMSGYRHDSPFTLGRHLRDAYGAALMINNDRILDNTAQLLLVSKEI
ncbi:MAG TPA: acyl-CoA dehydrogenase family protein [Acidimicrobiales bacterium]|nr:acyl-CoA dehydrogenase family protein [Acidimicrobiales bacterium]